MEEGTTTKAEFVCSVCGTSDGHDLDPELIEVIVRIDSHQIDELRKLSGLRERPSGQYKVTRAEVADEEFLANQAGEHIINDVRWHEEVCCAIHRYGVPEPYLIHGTGKAPNIRGFLDLAAPGRADTP